ncbi:rod shape-determining protein MreC [Jatrophihabitans telluris]|uniref:Cell shape-determining protein MreC n=1 Tax=Jatrophihabitans telluris TaxID=2038343 RepID=A0ABY4R3I9_9ACTN|nr:rod shape-determining protein MreC [Jatrophihabitans telluris]UQX89670.1 rod shape-determining protein MreC [Jatrophihabitans telluris]
MALAVVALLFISLDFAGGSLAGAHEGTRGALGSLYRGADGVLGPTRRFLQGIPDVGRNRQDLAALQQENARLRQRLTEAELDQATAKQLQALQLQARGAGWSATPARVIGTGPGGGFASTVTVDAGRADGVLGGASVTDGAGLVGRVLSVQAHTAVILLAWDPGFSVGARDLRSQDLLLAAGKAGTALTASPLGDAASMKVGDALVTGPAGESTFVSGLAIGTVTAVTTSADGSSSALIRPAADVTGLNLLGIIVPAGAHPSSTSGRPAVGGAG